jgi:hypothetical protein
LSQAWVLLAPLAVAGFLVYIAWLTGSFEAFVQNMADWGRGGAAVGATAAGGNIAAHFNPIQFVLLAVLCASIWPLVYARADGIRLEYVLIPILFIGVTFVSGNLESIGRYVTAAFPFAWVLANRRSAFWRRSWPAISAGLLALFAVLEFGGYWVP